MLKIVLSEIYRKKVGGKQSNKKIGGSTTEDDWSLHFHFPLQPFCIWVRDKVCNVGGYKDLKMENGAAAAFIMICNILKRKKNDKWNMGVRLKKSIECACNNQLMHNIKFEVIRDKHNKFYTTDPKWLRRFKFVDCTLIREFKKINTL